MSVEKDDLELRLEEQLYREVRRQLDQQLGRAAPYFLAHCGAPIRHRKPPRLSLAIAALAAACCSAFLVWRHVRPPVAEQPQTEAIASIKSVAPPIVRSNHTPENETANAERSATAPATREERTEARSMPGDAAARQPLILGRAFRSHTVDEGTLLVGSTPVRKLRRQWLERIEWFDPENGARVQRIVPREEVLFVPLPVN